MTEQPTSLRQAMTLMQQTDAEIGRVRGRDREWMLVLVRGERAQAAVNRAIDAYEGIARHG